MKPNLKEIDFLNWDRKFYEQFKKIRDKWSFPLVRKLDEWKIKPNQISWFRFLIALIGLFFIGYIDWLWMLFWLAFTVLDAWDGALARYQKSESRVGMLLDMEFDLLLKIFFVLKLIYVGYISGFWASCYLVGYLVNFFLAAILSQKRNQKFPMFPSSDFLTAAFLIFVLFGTNLFDVCAVFLSIFFAIKDIFLLDEFVKNI